MVATPQIETLGWLLIAAVAIVIALLLFVNVWILVKWSHPDDNNQYYGPKLAVILALTLTEVVILGLPIDVGNNAGALECSYEWGDRAGCGGMNMTVFWQVMFSALVFVIVVVIPFCLLYYEEVDEVEVLGKKTTKAMACCMAARFDIVVLLACGVILTIMYVLLAETRIPFATLAQDLDAFVHHSASIDSDGIPHFERLLSNDELRSARRADGGAAHLSMAVTFPVYVVALTSFVGWFLFAIFGGIGLTALPLDLLIGYKDRPIPLNSEQIAELKMSLQNRSKELVEIGASLRKERAAWKGDPSLGWLAKKRREGKDKVGINQFKQMVFLLEKDVEELKECSLTKDAYNPLFHVAKLIGGVFGCIVSVLWLAHIVLYMLLTDAAGTPLSPFLNKFLIQFDVWFPLGGAVSVAVLNLYLLACAIKGCFKFGMRFFLINLHPMKYNGTYMNSFLFNAALISLCAFPVVQFSTTAFAAYARYTDASVLFGAQVQYLRFFDMFYENKVFEIALLAWAGLAILYLAFCGAKDRPASAAKMRATLKARSDESFQRQRKAPTPPPARTANKENATFESNAADQI